MVSENIHVPTQRRVTGYYKGEGKEGMGKVG